MLSNIFNPDSIRTFLTEAFYRVIPALMCITFHELAHGYTAYRLGDRTAKDMGRLTLNPIKHIDVFGLLMMIVFRFGWAKPVPVDMRNFRKPKWFMAITALAGPLSNIILAAIVLFLYGLVFNALGGVNAQGAGLVFRRLIVKSAYLSVALAIFNLIPIPPLDGSKVLFSLLSEKTYYKLMHYERYGIFVLLLVLNTGVFRSTVGRLTETVFDGMMVIWAAAYRLVNFI